MRFPGRDRGAGRQHLEDQDDDEDPEVEAAEGQISPRLPLDVTVHTDRFDDAAVTERIAAYEAERAEVLAGLAA